MTDVNIEINGLYSRKDKDKKPHEYRVAYEAQVEARPGFWNSFENVNDIADAIRNTDKKNNIENPKHKIIRVKGSMPSGKELYTDKPPKKVEKELADLLRDGNLGSYRKEKKPEER